MASILDSGLASIFTKIFIFLLVYALVYGVLSARKVFGDKGHGLHAMIGFVVAMLAAIAPQTERFLGTVVPYYVMLFIVIFFILFIVSMFGRDSSSFPEIINDNRVYTWILIFAILIFVIGLGTTFGPGLTPGGKTVVEQQPQVDPNLQVIGGDVPYADPGTIAPGPYPSNGYYGGAQGIQAGQPGSTATSDFGTNLTNTIFHPKVLGMIVTLLIAAVSVFFLSTQN